jgi:seryl-tRNA synthetase
MQQPVGRLRGVIDIRLVREQPDLVRASQRARGEDESLVGLLVTADEERRAAGVRFDTTRAEQKDVGRQVAQASGADRDALLARGRELAEAVRAAETERDEAAARADAALMALSNVVEPDAPVGGEADFRVIEHVGSPRDFAAEGFEPRDHLELGQLLGAIDVVVSASPVTV